MSLYNGFIKKVLFFLSFFLSVEKDCDQKLHESTLDETITKHTVYLKKYVISLIKWA